MGVLHGGSATIYC